MTKIFVDTVHAAEMLGLGRRQFFRKYIETGLLTPIRMVASKSKHGQGDRLHLFLVKDVERVKAEASMK